MDAKDFRALAERCRELHQIAVREEVRVQLRQWADDFDAEAKAAEKPRNRRAAERTAR